MSKPQKFLFLNFLATIQLEFYEQLTEKQKVAKTELHYSVTKKK
jgi:hypothetical protein